MGRVDEPAVADGADACLDECSGDDTLAEGHEERWEVPVVGCIDGAKNGDCEGRGDGDCVIVPKTPAVGVSNEVGMGC